MLPTFYQVRMINKSTVSLSHCLFCYPHGILHSLKCLLVYFLSILLKYNILEGENQDSYKCKMNVSKIVSTVLQLIERRMERTPQFQAIRKVEVNLHKDVKNDRYPQG